MYCNGLMYLPLHLIFIYLFLFKVWSANMITNDDFNLRLVNTEQNGFQTEGDVLHSVGFNVRYPRINPVPDIARISFNDILICPKSPTPGFTNLFNQIETFKMQPVKNDEKMIMRNNDKK